jgi:hypothetical protein
MKRLRFWLLVFCTLLLEITLVGVQPSLPFGSNWINKAHQAELEGINLAGDRSKPSQLTSPKPQVPETTTLSSTPRLGRESREFQPFEHVIRGAEKLQGLFTLYRHQETGKVYLEIRSNQLNQNFLSIITLESGIGEGWLYRGMPIKDFPFQFRRVQNNIHFVVPNFYFRTTPSDPQRRSVEESFSDSVLFSLPIVSIHSEGQTVLVDLDDLLLKGRDLPDLASQFNWILSQSYTPDPTTSYLGDVKTFPLNVEIESVYGFSAGPNSGNSSTLLDILPDQRAFNLTVHYSFSQLPSNNGFHPRLADDRVGYFVTAYQDLSNLNTGDPFVRYINRWHLEPKDPNKSLSSPKDPIVFWIENTVPLKYRDAIREGILLWNAAFEQAGFKDAIEVRQMPDDADWNPADVRYNTVRWSNSFQSSLLGIAPSRVNPLTGQILDADVRIDANAVRILEEDAGVLIQNHPSLGSSLSSLPFCSHGMKSLYLRWLAVQNNFADARIGDRLISEAGLPDSPLSQERCFGMEAAQQMAMGALALSTLQNVLPSSDEMQEYIYQFLRLLTAHEIGHTLGLRHNFRGSTMLSPDELQDTEITQTRGLTGSVMDYHPVNLAAQGVEQGDYFATILGPYDKWAIEYGYKPIRATNSRTEQRELQQIAQRAAEPGLSYATDEDAYNPLDPTANVWDLSGDVLHHAQLQMDNAQVVWDRLDRRYPLPGESYSELRDRFNTVFFYYFNNAMNVTRYVGGRKFNRARRGDPGARQPFETIPIENQRQALIILNHYIFGEDTFRFSPELVNQLAPSRWNHWGSLPEIFSLDYPIYDNFLFLQSVILSELLSSDRLSHLRDGELHTTPGEMLTIPELFDTLQSGIWTEVLQRDREITTISSLRRGLQRQYLAILINMTLRNPNAPNQATNLTDFIVALQTLDAPEDARVIARHELDRLQDAIASTLRHQGDRMDTATKAHLEEARDRITKVLEAAIQSN